MGVAAEGTIRPWRAHGLEESRQSYGPFFQQWPGESNLAVGSRQQGLPCLPWTLMVPDDPVSRLLFLVARESTAREANTTRTIRGPIFPLLEFSFISGRRKDETSAISTTCSNQNASTRSPCASFGSVVAVAIKSSSSFVEKKDTIPVVAITRRIAFILSNSKLLLLHLLLQLQ